MYTLKGKKQTVVFSEEGSIVAFRDESIDRDYIAKGEKKSPLFRIGCAEYEQGERQYGDIVFSSRLVVPEVEVGQDQLLFRYEYLGEKEIHVACKIRMCKEDGLCHFSIEIENHTELGLHYLEYPVMELCASIGKEAESNRIVLPKQDGYLLPSPRAKAWEGDLPYRRWDQRFEYPGNGREFPENLSAQFLAYYDTEGGFYMAVYDGEGNPKKIGPVWQEAEEESISFTPYFHISPVSGNQYVPGYDVVAGCFRGDWQDAAELYKQFAVRQSWCARKISEREDIPEWIKRGAMFFHIRLRGQEDEDYFSKLPEYMREWKRTWDMPMVAMMCGWEKLGEWVGPDYFPPYGGEEGFKRLCEALKKEGIKSFPFGLSGLKLPLRRMIGKDCGQLPLAIDYNNRKRFREYFSNFAATDAEGRFIMDSGTDSWDGLHAYACVGTEQAYTQLYGAAMQLAEYGAEVVQVDQLFGGGVTECYRSEHGHLPGRGKWQVDRIAQIYDDIRRDGKRRDPSFALSQEFMSELFIQHLDICHGRVFDEPRGVEGIPLFAYLYHEYVPCYGGDWSSQLSDNTCGVYNHAANFVYGSLPAACSHTLQKSMKNELPAQCDDAILKIGRNCGRLHWRFSKFFVEGRMLRYEKLAVSSIPVRYTGQNFSGWKKGCGMQPAVLHCRWEAPDGSQAWVFANISDEVQEVQWNVEGAATELVLWRNDEKEQKIRTAGGTARIRLYALDAAVVTAELESYS